jgi:hypothetical protein
VIAREDVLADYYDLDRFRARPTTSRSSRTAAARIST